MRLRLTNLLKVMRLVNDSPVIQKNSTVMQGIYHFRFVKIHETIQYKQNYNAGYRLQLLITLHHSFINCNRYIFTQHINHQRNYMRNKNIRVFCFLLNFLQKAEIARKRIHLLKAWKNHAHTHIQLQLSNHFQPLCGGHVRPQLVAMNSQASFYPVYEQQETYLDNLFVETLLSAVA